MEKVKLTQEQADAIEGYRKEHGDRFLMNAHSLRRWTRGMRPCNELDNDEMARALYIGYEVERPPLQAGDWAVDTKGRVGILREVPTTDTPNHLYIDSVGFRTGEQTKYKDFKHPTQEQIEKEKQFRFWKRHGRDVWELKKGDVLTNTKNRFDLFEFKDYVNVGTAIGYSTLTENLERLCKTTAKEHYKILCFAEDRKDLIA